MILLLDHQVVHIFQCSGSLSKALYLAVHQTSLQVKYVLKL
jgi:hypothetical protein